MSNARRNHLVPLLLALAALALASCTSTIDMLPEKVGGLPATAPARPADPLPVPNVYEVRPTREARPLDTTEQKKLETDLTNLRESQKARANPPPPPPPPPPSAAKKTAAKKAVAKDAATAKKPPADPTQ
jgi:hypothetical protein